MNSKEYYKSVYDQDGNQDVPNGWIQWKGTDVCMDIHCKCGENSHVDGDFQYFFVCPKCKTSYAVGCNVKMIELTPEQIEHNADHPSYQDAVNQKNTGEDILAGLGWED